MERERAADEAVETSEGPAEGSRIAVAQAALLAPGTRLGPYLVRGVLGRGATAFVYRAQDEALRRDIALKVLHPQATGNVRDRFLREVRLIATLAHPNVVAVHAAGEQDGRYFAAMELLPESLANDLARRGQLPWAEALRAARDACLGLQAAYARGIIHRDIKPSNLLREASGAVKVGDFGLAKDVSRDLDLTQEGVVVGTPYYVSPEQGSGRALDHRADIYSLGATLYHLLCGRPPFHGSTALETIVRHAVEPPPPLPEGIPFQVSSLVLALLEKDPARRPASYGELVERLDAALESHGAATAPTAKRLTADPLAASQLAVARAAFQIGRIPRAREIFERLFREREAGWVEAALGLAPLLEKLDDLSGARAALEAVVAGCEDKDVKALALWSLGTLAERESEAAVARALAAYQQVLEVSETAFPKTLLEARIAKLGGRKREKPA